MATKMSGSARAADDIEEVKWFKVDDIKDYERHAKMIVPEHLDFFGKLIEYFETNGMINKSNITELEIN